MSIVLTSMPNIQILNEQINDFEKAYKNICVTFEAL